MEMARQRMPGRLQIEGFLTLQLLLAAAGEGDDGRHHSEESYRLPNHRAATTKQAHAWVSCVLLPRDDDQASPSLVMH